MISLWTAFTLGHYLGYSTDQWWAMPFFFTSFAAIILELGMEIALFIRTTTKWFD